MGAYKTPGVYIVEKDAFPNSVVEVATAVPAFIGYTQKASKNNKSVIGKPTRISSMAEFHNIFGMGPVSTFELADAADEASADVSVFDLSDPKDGASKYDKHFSLTHPDPVFRLYRSMQMFYLNGGGPCYIVSVGKYAEGDIKAKTLQDGIGTLIKEQEPTMVVIPDAMSLVAKECYSLQGQMLKHCGVDMRNRFAILDIHNGFQNQDDSIAAFRNAVITKEMGDFGAAYFPWLNSTLVSDSDVNFTYLNKKGVAALQKSLKAELNPAGDLQDMIKAMATPEAAGAAAPADAADAGEPAEGEAGADNNVASAGFTVEEIHKALWAVSNLYRPLMKEISRQLNLVPPSSAMAGLYTMTDNGRGVWKAPANIGVLGVSSPAFEISDEEQKSLNVDVNGKSVNAIRSFIGEGTLVWGARTLDGNSLDWRYVNVRRTMIMLEQSVKLAAKAYVFEPNDAQTWITVKSMIANFLTGIWKRGGLAGAVPSDAFSVHVGLGETMTPEDILEGYMRITVLVAVTRPAEFIEITFQQQMQKS